MMNLESLHFREVKLGSKKLEHTHSSDGELSLTSCGIFGFDHPSGTLTSIG